MSRPPVVDGEVDEQEREYEREVEVDVDPVTAMTRGEVDMQIVTARRYPRSVSEFMKQAEELVSLSQTVAAQCFYVLPARRSRGGGKNKPIEGPSARFAEIIAYAWEHLRIEGRPIREEERFIVSRGTAWDIQKNVARAFEVRRRITTSEGERFGDDMIAVTGLAATSIAGRNAVLAVIPKPYWEPAYLKARKVAVGDLKSIVTRRAAAIDEFGKMGVTEDRILMHLEVRGRDDITIDHLVTLLGIYTALKEGTLSLEEAFPLPAVTPPRRRPRVETPQGSPAAESAPGVTTETTPPVSEADEEPSAAAVMGPVVVFVDYKEHRKGQMRTATLTDEQGQAYLVENADLLPYAKVAADKRYRVAIGTAKRGDTIVVEEMSLVES